MTRYNLQGGFSSQNYDERDIGHLGILKKLCRINYIRLQYNLMPPHPDFYGDQVLVLIDAV